MRKKTLNEKIFYILLICIFSMVTIFGFKKIYSVYKTKQDEKKLWGERDRIADTVVFRDFYKEMGDGWYYDIFQRRHEEVPGEYVYVYAFSGCNIKYETLEDNYGEYIDQINPENNSKIPMSPPALVTSYKSKNGIKTEGDELIEVNNLLTSKEWNRKITKEDLASIDFVNFNAEDIVELWNGLQDETYIKKTGPYISLGTCTFRKEKKDNNYYQVGAYIQNGFLKDVKIDYVFGDKTYLSDKYLNNTATEKEKNIYDNIKLIENKIKEKESFNVESEFEKLKTDSDYEQIFTLLSNLEKNRGKD